MNLKQFLIKLSIIAFALIVIDRGAGKILAHEYHHIRHGEQGRTNWTMDSCRAETVVLGSSRAEHHYVSGIIGEGLAASCYNAGKDKQRLPYCLAVLKALYARYSPGTIILDLNPTAFNTDENGLSELSILLPYYHTNPELRPIIKQRNFFEPIKVQSYLYCYNSLPLKILFNSVSDYRDQGESAGYVPLTTQKEIIPASAPELPETFPLDNQLLDCFREIMALTKKNKTRLGVVVSPVFYKMPVDLATITLARSMTKAAGVSFLDYSQEFIQQQNGRSAFLDLFHLNDSAAKVFSACLAKDIHEIRRNPDGF